MSLGVVLVALLASSAYASVSCLDENGKHIDWWVALKTNNDAAYYIATAKSPKFVQSKFGMDGYKGAIAETLSQTYKKMPAEYGVAMYNDDTDEGHTNSGRAHAKGVVLFDSKQGFWMIHSLPRYPSRRGHGYDGIPDIKFGQSFMCITMKTAEFDLVGEQLRLMHPLLYDWDITEGLAEKLPKFDEFLRDERPTSDVTNQVVSFTSAGGQHFTHYGKSKKFDGNLYGDMVAPGLKQNIYVESWMNGDHQNQMNSPARAHGYATEHVWEVEMSDGRSWVRTQDHSKWVVTQEKGSVCIGDINRQYSQQNRGGGTMCVKNAGIWQAFYDAVASVDKSVAQHESSVTTRQVPFAPWMIGSAMAAMGLLVGGIAAMAFKRRANDTGVELPEQRYVAFQSPALQKTATGTWREQNCV